MAHNYIDIWQYDSKDISCLTQDHASLYLGIISYHIYFYRFPVKSRKGFVYFRLVETFVYIFLYDIAFDRINKQRIYKKVQWRKRRGQQIVSDKDADNNEYDYDDLIEDITLARIKL